MDTVIRKIDHNNYAFWCIGCDEAHQISSMWEFNNDYEKPTFSPSYLTWLDPNPNVLPGPQYDKYRKGFRCHSFIRDGRIEYLSDCTHALAGKTVEMVKVK